MNINNYMISKLMNETKAAQLWAAFLFFFVIRPFENYIEEQQ
ncbi:hypothetical protein NEOCIP111885_04187 [Pseudoneobacillus rhizosphaerae]|uniref:Uncharacterized protein n=1 Tax=Pseudoneobacillus rhizosphaerae TaxID=2880968 RepID=A0A9C7LCT7_9BACI|nr:hypothetical protein NEOCIP111885_04187 [Pseudoneobacillus rhizosphaerae]